MAKIKRHDGRSASELRPVKITPGFVRSADGSALIEMGKTRVICTASLTAGLPRWRQDSGLGWLTAEYGMLPASTASRKPRPIGKPDSRCVEIQRIIGRVMRNTIRFDRLGESTIILDCDVLEADGGTRTAAITGAQVALALAVERGIKAGLCGKTTLCGSVAAISVGIVNGKVLLDLDYLEDSAAHVDMNVAMVKSGKFVEIQGSSERNPFDSAQLDEMLRLAKRGISKLFTIQTQAIARGLRK